MSGASDLSTSIGNHYFWWGKELPRPTGFFSAALNLDTVFASLIVYAIILVLALLARRRLNLERPSGVQNLMEMSIEFVQGFVNDSLSPKLATAIAPLAIALFLYILVSNWLGLLPVGQILAIVAPHNTLPEFHSPTSDLNTTLALALLVIVVVQAQGIRSKGLGGHFKHFLEPFPALAPLTIVEEIAKPITLMFRLFGNVFAGEVLILVFGSLLPFWAVPIPHIFALGLGLFVGGIQAFIFTMLTIAYIGIATTHEEGH